MNQINCKFCQKPFIPARLGTTFCKSKCRQDYKNRIRAYEKAVAQKERDLEELRSSLELAKSSLINYKQEKTEFEAYSEKQYQAEEKLKNSYKQMLSLAQKDLYTLLWKNDLKDLKSPIERANLEAFYKLNNEDIIKDTIGDFQAKKERVFTSIDGKRLSRNLKYLNVGKDPKEETIQSEIDQFITQIRTLEQTEIKLKLPLPEEKLTTNFGRKDKRLPLYQTDSPIEMEKFTGAQIRKMHFEAFTFSGELGEFLGQLDRNMVAFALTGESGAGKSYFSYELARLFVKNKMSVCYFSFEEGVGQLTQDKLDQFGLGTEIDIVRNPKGKTVSIEARLQSVHKNAENYDVIIIDSYSKIATSPKEYDILRQTHPQTLFVVIFQKTTGKTIRGGSSITYDSSAIINVTVIKDKNNKVKERFAQMEKSRYGTANWVYSATRGKIVSRG